MKKKGRRAIPDFSRKRPPTASSPDVQTAKGVVPRAVRAIKPQATSAKSGRRGQ